MINVKNFKKDNGVCTIKIPLSSVLEDDLNHETLLNDKVKYITNQLLNDNIVDYEKIGVSPIYSYYHNGEELFKDVKHIVYKILINKDSWLDVFSENDIKYQKKCVKSTFLRHLFFDSDNILDQNLISFSTSFLNSGSIYLWLINGKDKNEGLKIKIPRYDIKNTRLSSESFSFITYKNNIIEDGMPIYCRYEFNDAKNGVKSILTTKSVSNVNINNVSKHIFSELKVHKINNEFYFSFNEGVEYDNYTKTLTVVLNEITI